MQKERIGILMQDSLKQIGMDIKIEKLAYAQFNELQQGSKLQMWTDEWISWVNDPFYHVSLARAVRQPEQLSETQERRSRCADRRVHPLR